MLDTLHGKYAVGVGATLLGGITRQSLVDESEIRAAATSGEVYARYIGLYRHGVSPSFSTLQIATALGLCGMVGADIADLTGGLALYAQQWEKGATRTAGGNHRSYTFADGMIAPTRLTVGQGGDAELEYAAAITYDGSNAIYVVADSVSLPAITADAERYAMGPIDVAGVTLDHVQRLTIDFGIGLKTMAGDGSLYDTFAGISRIAPEITVEGVDPTWLKSTNIPVGGKAATQANTTIYLRKRSPGATFVADETEQHVKFNAAGMAWIPNPFDAGDEHGTTTLKLRCIYDGTNYPIKATTAAAIT